MKLSILICHLFGRADSLAKLMAHLGKQCEGGEVEILIDADSGQKTTGMKRNTLLNAAKGEYVAFVDDDDWVSDTYIADILESIKSKPDCVGLVGIMTRNGQWPERFVHSVKCTDWYHVGDWPNRVFYRYPNHLNPIRRYLALQVGFPELTVGEDRNFSDRIRPLLVSEIMVSTPLYYYLAT